MSRSPSFSLKGEPSAKLDTQSLQQWVVSFCTIRFDLEQGQVIEECYPSGSLTQDEELETAFSSFPDSISQHHNRSSIHDCIFFFRFRRRGKSEAANVSSSEIVEIDDDSSQKSRNGKVSNKLNQGPSNDSLQFLYGYVFNRQRHDERLKRGGEQKSVVILSHHPYSSVFRPLLQIVGPLYFDIGKKALEHIAAYVSTWPAPVPGKMMELPIGNATLKVYLPPSHCLPLDSRLSFDKSANGMASSFPMNQSVPQGLFHDANVFGIFRGLLLQLWTLWELLVIGEPVLIIAPTAPQCSEAVAGLVSLVAPLMCSIDFRPYFTIHDPEFAHLNSIENCDTFPPMVLGVTNLFFLKSLRNIPHIVSVGSPVTNSSRATLTSRSTGRLPGLSEASGIERLKNFSPSSLLNAVKLRRDGPLCLMTEHREAIWSTYAATTKPDTSILNRLIDAGSSSRVEESMSVVNNEILRRHFFELTTNFLAPFSPYFKITTPAEGCSPFLDPPALPSFNEEDFLATLSARGPGKFLLKRMRSNWLDLYRRFLRGPNFLPWFRRRCAGARQEQHRLWRQVRLKTDIQQLLPKFSEVQVVDSFNAIERLLLQEMQLQYSGSGGLDSEAICKKLKEDLQAVFNMLPRDMQQLLLMNPERAALITRADDVSTSPI